MRGYTEINVKPKIVSGDLNTVGSEICIGEECFYLMYNDGYNVTMFAKHNLNLLKTHSCQKQKVQYNGY